MTQFEAQQIILQQWALLIQAASAVTGLGALVCAIIAGRIVLRQLRASQWNSVLQLEADMNHRWRDFSDLAAELGRGSDELTADQRRNFQSRHAALQESYLNAVNRLASSILNGEFPEDRLRADYRSFIEDALRTFPDAHGAGTRFHHTVNLHQRWLH